MELAQQDRRGPPPGRWTRPRRSPRADLVEGDGQEVEGPEILKDCRVNGRCPGVLEPDNVQPAATDVEQTGALTLRHDDERTIGGFVLSLEQTLGESDQMSWD